jgi:hypothetical protein
MATPTLHDFVLNLLVDPAARTAFELDPEGVLTDAGLGDITEADVQEVIPLVVDYAPIGGLTGLVAADEPVLGGIDGDVTGAVRQLQDITQLATAGTGHGHGPGSDLSVNATAAAGVSVNLDGLPLAGGGVPVLGGGFGLSPLGDPAGTLDAVDPALEPVLGTVAPVTGVAEPVLQATDPVLHTADPVLHTTDPLLHTADPILGTVDVTLDTVTALHPVAGTVDALGLSDLTGTAAPHTVVDPLTHTVSSTVSGVTGGVSGHADPAHTDQGHADPGHDGGLLGLLH